METGILLESGTNELEILEFRVANNYYGINVAKIREIISFQTPTPVPNADRSSINFISIFNISKQQSFNIFNDEYPLPKSSISTLNPYFCNVCIAIMRSGKSFG